MTTAEICRIAVVRPNHRLGNALLLTPLLAELEMRFPGAEVDIVTTGRAATEVYQGYTRIGTVYSFPARSWTSPMGVLSTMAALRRRSYDLAIDAVPESRSARLILEFLDARYRLGFESAVSWKNRVLTHAVTVAGAPQHIAHMPVHLLRAGLGCDDCDTRAQFETVVLDIRLTPAERRAGRRRLDAVLGQAERRTAKSLGIFAAATGAKRFAPGWWQQMAAGIQGRLPHVRLIEFVPDNSLPVLKGEIPFFYSTSLRELGATLAATSEVVSADCGVMHLAGASGAATLGLFKTTDPARYGPIGPGSTALRAEDDDPDAVAKYLCDRLLAAPIRPGRLKTGNVSFRAPVGQACAS